MNEVLLILLTIVFIPALILFALVVGAVWNRANFLLRNKGYAPIQTAIISFILPAITALTGVGILIVYPMGEDAFSFGFIAWGFCFPFANWLLSIILPSKKKRLFGPRYSKFPFKQVAFATLIIFGAFFVFSIYNLRPLYKNLGQFFKFILQFVILPGYGMYYYLNNRFKLYKRLNIDDKLTQDLRKPILFIRSFQQDFDPFFLGNVNMNGVYNQLLDELYLFKQDNMIKAITFQEYFIKAFEDNLGILTSLGNPEDKDPLEGTYSNYYTDNEWQEQFNKWAGLSICILATPGVTNGLMYELMAIRENNWHEKFFIFTKPVRQPLYKKVMMPLVQWSRLVKPTKWSDFATNLHQAGFWIQDEEPAPGTIIGFDRYGEQVVVTTNAINPLSYTTPLVRYLGTEHTTVRS